MARGSHAPSRPGVTDAPCGPRGPPPRPLCTPGPTETSWCVRGHAAPAVLAPNPLTVIAPAQSLPREPRCTPHSPTLATPPEVRDPSHLSPRTDRLSSPPPSEVCLLGSLSPRTHRRSSRPPRIRRLGSFSPRTPSRSSRRPGSAASAPSHPGPADARRARRPPSVRLLSSSATPARRRSSRPTRGPPPRLFRNPKPLMMIARLTHPLSTDPAPLAWP